MKNFVLIMILCSLLSCSSNNRAKNLGGTMTIDLPKDTKLVNITWKNDDDIWYLTRPMTSGEEAQTYTFKEKTGLNFLSGSVIIKESKSTVITDIKPQIGIEYAK
jgi:hypothetical protein